MKFINVSFIFFVISLLISCGDINKEEIEGSVTDVIDGNTVELSTGTIIHLCGISPDNTFTKEYMERNYIGKNVCIFIESEDEPTIGDYDEEFYAYLSIVDEDGIPTECINSTLLKLEPKAFSGEHCKDSLVAYNTNTGISATPLRPEVLAAKMKAATLQIHAANEEGSWLGSAFFINENGLALTNCHCVEGAQAMLVLLSDGEGNVTSDKRFSVKRIVETNKDYDYAIFYVDLDEDSKKNISTLPISKMQVSAGMEAFSVGNPAPSDGFNQTILPMRFNSGNVSSYNEQDRRNGRIAINVPITHGFSGGPLCNLYGQVIGINVSGYENSDANLNFAVDIKVVREKLDELHLIYDGK